MTIEILMTITIAITIKTVILNIHNQTDYITFSVFRE